MKQTIVYVGLDIEGPRHHGSALDKNTGEAIDFRCRPTLKGLLGQLAKLGKHVPGCTLRLCYEASYIGYALQRDLAEKGYHCDVVAPTSIPSPRGKQIKTDRIDATQLAQFYANGLLTCVSTPEPELEQDRDLMRSRQNLLQQQTDLRKHMQALLRRNGLHYKAQTQTNPTISRAQATLTLLGCFPAISSRLPFLFRRRKQRSAMSINSGAECARLAFRSLLMRAVL